jgi:hydrogenase small subunit
MLISRREFLKYCSAMAGALGLSSSGLIRLQRVLASEEAPPVVWLQGQNCTGCSVSLLNTIHYMTIDDLLLNTIDLEFHSTVMAAAGDLAVSAAETALDAGGYILVIEGSIPVAENGKYCYLWQGMTALEGVEVFSEKAAYIVAVGTCAAYGGLVAGEPNPTGAKGVSEIVNGKPLINLPGCPTHPDWIVGTIAHLLTYGEAPRLDTLGRPRDYYQKTVHSQCPNQKHHTKNLFAQELSESGCLYKLGCQGIWTGADCPIRKWNSGATGAYGVNWCIGGRSPCQGCTEPDFPDGKSPWYTLELP